MLYESYLAKVFIEFKANSSIVSSQKEKVIYDVYGLIHVHLIGNNYVSLWTDGNSISDYKWNI